MKIKIKKEAKDLVGITMPAIDGDAGYDIYASEDKTIDAHQAASIHTGIHLEIPCGYWMEIMPKSGLATKHNIAVHNGVIDNGYRGEIIIHVYNHGDKPYSFKKNEKVAQGIIRKLHVFELEEVDELNESTRGNAGFGSTGK